MRKKNEPPNLAEGMTALARRPLRGQAGRACRGWPVRPSVRRRDQGPTKITGSRITALIKLTAVLNPAGGNAQEAGRRETSWRRCGPMWVCLTATSPTALLRPFPLCWPAHANVPAEQKIVIRRAVDARQGHARAFEFVCGDDTRNPENGFLRVFGQMRNARGSSSTGRSDCHRTLI